MNNHNGWSDWYFIKKHSPKNLNSATCQILMIWWKVMSTWYYRGSCKLLALKLHSGCSYIVVIKVAQVANVYDFHMWWFASVAAHATCPIAFTPIEIC
jgi:hypothetical protein